jgi:geranylgeranyl diphosphate synthase, type I
MVTDMQLLSDYFEKNIPLIEKDMKEYINSSIPSTYQELKYMLEYHMGWEGNGNGTQGKRIRPILAMLFGELCGHTADSLIPFCSSIELLHNFSLIHDDIEDHDEKRHGRDTVWKIWGIPQAINAGDLLFSLSTKSMFRAGGNFPENAILSAIEAFHLTCNRLTSGQFLDMKFEIMDAVEPSLYLEMIKGKTAALLGYCTMAGSILAGKSDAEIESYFQFGETLGIAFQIQDDYLGIWGDISKTGKASRSDLLSRKKSYPILLGLSNKGDFFRSWNQLEMITEKEADNLAAQLESEGVREIVTNEVKQYTDKANSILDALITHENKVGLIIRQLSDQLMNRNY